MGCAGTRTGHWVVVCTQTDTHRHTHTHTLLRVLSHIQLLTTVCVCVCVWMIMLHSRSWWINTRHRVHDATKQRWYDGWIDYKSNKYNFVSTGVQRTSYGVRQWEKTLACSLAVHQRVLLYLLPDGSRDMGALNHLLQSLPVLGTFNANLWCFQSSS